MGRRFWVSSFPDVEFCSPLFLCLLQILFGSLGLKIEVTADYQVSFKISLLNVIINRFSLTCLYPFFLNERYMITVSSRVTDA